MRCKGTVVVLHKVYSRWKFAGVLRFPVFSRWKLNLLGVCWSVFSQEDLRVLTLAKVRPLYLQNQLCKWLLVKDEGAEPGPADARVTSGPHRSWPRPTAAENWCLPSPEPTAETSGAREENPHLT